MDQSIQQTIINFKSLRENPVNYMRPVVLVLAGEIRHRIHVEGLSADGSPIGKYTNPYLKERQKKYNRDNSTKMIWSLTRQMEQDFVPIAENDVYGLGFNNKHNFDKATWLEQKSKQGTYILSNAEKDIAIEIITDYINGIFG